MTFGHGRPQVESFSLCGIQRILSLCALALALGWVGAFAKTRTAWAQAAQEVDCEFRIVWGGPNHRTYAGQISIDGGSLRTVRNLSLEPDSLGKIRARSPDTLELLPHNPSQFGGVDIHVRAPLSSSLKLEFADPYSGVAIEHDIPLSDVMTGNWIAAIDEHGARTAIERQMHDRLRVELDGSGNIFESGEELTVTMQGYRVGAPEGEYTLTAKFVHDDQPYGSVFNSAVVVDSTGSFPEVQWETHVPVEEGAHLLEFSLRRKRFLNNLVSSNTPYIRRLEMVVLDPQARTQRIAAWQPLLKVDVLEASKPGSLTWLAPLTELPNFVGMPEKWQQYTLIPDTLKPPVRHGELGSRQLPDSAARGGCLTIAPDAWLALPLPNLQVGVPHRIRVQVPTDLPVELAVSARTPDASGDFASTSPDSGFVIDARECRRDGSLATHDMTFWPSAGDCYILLANTHESQLASVASVELEVADLAFPEDELDTSAAGRMVGLYLDKPLLAETFSAPSSSDPVTNRQLNSWRTWFAATERLEQYMRWAQADTLVLKVFADGGSIFPSERLDPSRRYDSGAFFSDSRNPDIKDCLELLLRRMDREGQHLILALDFDAPLPGLATGDENQAATMLHNLSGGAWRRTEANTRVSFDRHNPLDSQVQAELLAVVQEITDRYADHASFAGISLQLDHSSQLVFPGDRWGFDGATLDRFADANHIQLPKADQLEQAFQGQRLAAFVRWRAAEMTKLYAQMAAAIRGGKSDAKLFLNAVRLWEERPHPDDFVDPDGIVRNPTQYLMAFGIDSEQLADVQGVMLTHGSLNRFWESNETKDWVLRLSSTRAMQSAASNELAAMVIQQPTSIRLPALEKLGGVKRNPGSRWIFPHASSYGIFARKKLIEQMYSADPQMLICGGWLPVAGHEQAVQSLYQTLREFPPIPLQAATPPDPQSNLRVRSGVYQGKTYVQLVNNAPWPEKVKLHIRSKSANPQLRALGELDRNSISVKGNLWEFQIQPFDLLGLEVADPSLQIRSVEHASSNQTLKRIAAELQAIETIIDGAGDPTQRKPLADVGGNFEKWSNANKPVGWNISSLPNVSIYRSNEFPHSGRSSIVIENGNATPASAWIQSRSINPPQTGRLAVQAWLRAPTAGDPMHVRLSVVGRHKNGERFERSQHFGSPGSESGIANDWGRRPATLFVADVPSQQLTEINLAIDVIGPGKVWIDDVQVFELQLHPDERIYLRGQLLVAKQELAKNNPYPAEQLLDSNWGHYLSDFRLEEDAAHRIASELPSPEDAETLSTDSDWNNPKPIFQQWRESIRERWRR